MMLYQLSGFLLLFILVIDLVLMLRVIQGIQLKKKGRGYVLVMIVFVLLSLFKMFFMGPHAFSSSPVDLDIKTDKSFDVCYFIDEVKDNVKVFWKEHIIGGSSKQSLDLETSVSDGFKVVKKIDGDWYAKDVVLNGNNTNTLDLADVSFEKVDQDITHAIDNYQWTIMENYFSHFLALVFVILIIWSIRKYGF